MLLEWPYFGPKIFQKKIGFLEWPYFKNNASPAALFHEKNRVSPGALFFSEIFLVQNFWNIFWKWFGYISQTGVSILLTLLIWTKLFSPPRCHVLWKSYPSEKLKISLGLASSPYFQFSLGVWCSQSWQLWVSNNF